MNIDAMRMNQGNASECLIIDEKPNVNVIVWSFERFQ